MNQNSVPASVTSILSTIHKVDGFDPTPLAVEYMDLTTQEKRKRLPVMASLSRGQDRNQCGGREGLLRGRCPGVCEL